MKKRFCILALILIAFAHAVVFPVQTLAQPEQIKIPVLVYHYFAKDSKEAQAGFGYFSRTYEAASSHFATSLS
ncbi:hypothetical protein Calkr_2244 [Caldicellulosiruptor acetigenus I77R1B]|uniref:Polysaccharide deacetylase n=2 Tax=Caldicellulosiruptor acetigenus TaxID=301953 RepID=G2PWE3_9FIRM|nr:hypothetical protein [Caldicellulosiruptor acetigenus]ADQ41706.1 hypothetical protein Calkr_2244 [Caldicellulosiruptor acetigenus I77R1B]AEM72887.1 hypothetical protein Calla_0207 [Caldicellulosiruptor acetigenus 6A]